MTSVSKQMAIPASWTAIGFPLNCHDIHAWFTKCGGYNRPNERGARKKDAGRNQSSRTLGKRRPPTAARGPMNLSLESGGRSGQARAGVVGPTAGSVLARPWRKGPRFIAGEQSSPRAWPGTVHDKRPAGEPPRGRGRGWGAVCGFAGCRCGEGGGRKFGATRSAPDPGRAPGGRTWT
jgi:hypothetical protein